MLNHGFFDGPITPALASRRRRFGLRPVRSPLLGVSFLLSLPPGTKMFQFPGFASALRTDAGIAPGGLPHSDIRGSPGICPSPRLFAACHVLLRLREPRHPPCALVTFRYIFFPDRTFHGYGRMGLFRLMPFIPCLPAWRSLLWFEFSTLCLLASPRIAPQLASSMSSYSFLPPSLLDGIGGE